MNFADNLIKAIKEKQNPVCVGLDTDLKKVPKFLQDEFKEKHGNTFEAAGRCIFEFNKRIIFAIKDIVPAIKIQVAFYEEYGMWGTWAYEETVKLCKEVGLITIFDAKRNDIGNTAGAYSNSIIGKVDLFGEKIDSLNADSVTVNGYLGSDGVIPFIDDCKCYGKGIFVLVKTSNPSSGELQDIDTSKSKKVYEIMAENVNIWGKDLIGERGYSSVGAVVGATYPEEAKKLRLQMPNSIFLVPGYGAQGGGAKDILPCFNEDGFGAIINNSRGIIFAYQKTERPEEEFAQISREAAVIMKEDITKALRDVGICPW